MKTYSDEALRKFLDGDISEAEHAEIIAQLEQDPELEHRLMDLDHVGPVVHAAFKDIAPQTAFDMSNFPPADTSHANRWRPLLIAATVTGIAVLGTGAFFNNTSAVEPWMQQVATYQALYSPETIAHVVTDPAMQTAELQRAETALDIDLHSARLADVDGLSLVRAQLLAFEGRPLTQIVFADAAGQPIALCIIETGDGTDDGIAFAQLEGMPSASFSNDGFSFLLIGPTDTEAIASYATSFKGIFSQG